MMFRKFLLAQMHKIDIEKWFEGLRRNCDPGQGYIVEWINKNAHNFRDDWEKSSCRYCKKECTYQAKLVCENFVEEV